VFGEELKGMTKTLVDSRQQVQQRMGEEAEAKRANAIVAMRFDTSEVGGNRTEICLTELRYEPRSACRPAERGNAASLALRVGQTDEHCMRESGGDRRA
jgi:hypothetical protein